jgi:RNA polymerase sigma factor (sigma-70 family)
MASFMTTVVSRTAAAASFVGMPCPPVDAGQHVGLARYIARQFRHQGAVCGFDLDDLTGEASVALVHASQTFIPAKGIPFKSYGGRVIRNYLINFLARRRLPAGTWHLGARGHLLELQAPPPADYDAREEVGHLLRVLQWRERFVIESRFGLGCEEMSIADIASVLEVSPQRVGQIIGRAITRMRAAAERDGRKAKSPCARERQLRCG